MSPKIPFRFLILLIPLFVIAAGCATTKTGKPSSRDPEIIEAAASGDVEVVEELIAAGADVDTRSGNGNTAIIEAGGTGYAETIAVLIAAGAEIDAANDVGQTALMYASQNGHVDVVGMLLEAGAAYDHQAGDGATALFHAAFQGNEVVIALLLESGADPSILNGAGQSTLMAAAGHPGITRMFLESGVDPNIRDDLLQTALHFAVENDAVDGVRQLVDAGADPNAANYEDVSPFMKAISVGDPELVRLLLDAGADPNQPSEDLTPLAVAAMAADRDVVELLIDAGADVGATISGGMTALHAAAFVGNLGAAEALLDAGIDANVVAESGMTAHSYARYLEYEDVEEFLWTWMCDWCSRTYESTFLPFPLDEPSPRYVSSILTGPDAATKDFDVRGSSRATPQGITYKKISAKRYRGFSEAFLRDAATGPDALARRQGDDPILVGPRLTTLLSRAGALEGQPENGVVGQVPVWTPFITYSFASQGEFRRDLLKLSRNLIYAGGDVIVRRMTTTEMEWYWAIIAWDIEDPALVFENDEHVVFVDFNDDGSVFYVDLWDHPDW